MKIEAKSTEQSLLLIRFYHEDGTETEIVHRNKANESSIDSHHFTKVIELKANEKIIGIWGKKFTTFASGKLSKFGFVIATN
jgi:hypothetical protein